MSLAAVFDSTGNTVLEQTALQHPGPGQLLVQIHSGALNPTDWKHFAAGWGSPGCIVGSDSSGVVVEVGEDVSDFKVGDHVSSFSHGGYSKDKLAGSFQQYAIYDTITTLKHDQLVDGTGDETKVTTFQTAAAVNLGLFTVGMSLCYQFKLEPGTKYEGDWILIVAGSSATGILGIQVAKKMFGLNVITTANPKYADYLKDLGADVIVDYKQSNEDIISNVKEATKDNVKYALDTVSSEESLNLANDALRTEGDAFLDNLLFLQPSQLKAPKSNVKFGTTLVYLVVGRNQDLNGMVLESNDEIVNTHIKFAKYVNKLVNDGTIVSQPLTVLPKGLSSINEGFKMLKEGQVHCTKLVFNVKDTIATD